VRNVYGEYRLPTSGLANTQETLGFDVMQQLETSDIDAIESTVVNGESKGYSEVRMPLNPKLTQLFRKFTHGIDDQDQLSIYKVIAVSSLRNVLTKVKNKLLDVLIELQDKFPDLEESFEPSPANKEKVQNIINYRVYGGSPNTNFGLGKKVHQHDISLGGISDDLVQILQDNNVPEDDIQEAVEIVRTDNKQNIPQKLMTWLGKMGQKAIEKGVEVNIPKLTQQLGELLTNL